MSVRVTQNEAETEQLGSEFAQLLRPGDIIAMTGDLGAGKTAFVRGLARGLGIPSRVTSPTFSIVNEYQGRIPLFHFDMYRLHSSEDLFDIGWEDYISAGGVCAVEWSENISDALPDDCYRVDIRRLSEEQRSINITGGKNENTCI